MTLAQAIEKFDDLKHNTYSKATKIGWISRLDTTIKKMIIDTHEGGGNGAFRGYDEYTDPDTELLVPEPFAEIYLRWLEAQVDYTNGEYDKYNNAIAMYQTAFDGYSDHYNRMHMPYGRNFRYF